MRLLPDIFVKRPFLHRSSAIRVHCLRKKGRFLCSRHKIRYLGTVPRKLALKTRPALTAKASAEAGA